MHKRLLALLLCLAAVAGAAGPALAAGEEVPEAVEAAQAAPAEEETGASEPLRLYIDGVPFEHEYTTVIGQVTYVSLPALVQAIRPSAALSWENARGAVARDEGLDLSAKPGNLYLYANGRYLYVPGGVQVGYDANGVSVCTLVPVRTLCQALGADVSWDGAVQITTDGTPLVSGEEFYDGDALFLLSHIIYNESGNQPLAGKIAVGNVLLNRVAHPSFPSTLYDVVYQPGQFYPEKTGCMEKTPNAESVLAAKLCLEGAVVVPNAYWFNGVGRSCWASRNKTCVAVIGGHAFYG